MELLIKKTNVITTIDGVPVRMWEGTDRDGNEGYHVFVHRIAAREGSVACGILARELDEQVQPDRAPAGLQPSPAVADVD
jgi:hypothetical protein